MVIPGNSKANSCLDDYVVQTAVPLQEGPRLKDHPACWLRFSFVQVSSSSARRYIIAYSKDALDPRADRCREGVGWSMEGCQYEQ